MRSLLDVNVLIALLDSQHTAHEAAIGWFSSQAINGWASSPITQNGCVRIMSHASYPNPLPISHLVERLRAACEAPAHRFWPDDVSLLDRQVVDPARIYGPRHLTDLYLLALAVHNDGTLVTFDGGISLDAVPGAVSRHLLRLH